jgi:acyl-CoA synthetase (AMP-forming)/AMP-acid ligase II
MPGGFDSAALTLPALIAHHARWRGTSPALVCGGEVRTWAEFDAATRRVAHGLRALGLGRGARLAVLTSNGLEMVELLFGAGRAGVSVVPLNVSVSDAAVAAMLADCGAQAIAASGEHCLRVGESLQHRLAIDAPPGVPGWVDYRAWRDAQPDAPCDWDVHPRDECNIIYSSGTTGLPKGIVHDHGCRANWATDLALALRYRSGAVTVCSIGLYSNIMWVAMLATILVGGTIVVLPSFSPESLLDAVARHRVTHGAFVPVQLQRLLEVGIGSRDLTSLETIMCCGAPLAPAVKRAIPRHLGCELIELYGLTEGLITTLDPEDLERKIESVGRPIPGQQITLLDASDREAPPGEPGEIVGLGRVTMSGYHGRPDATTEATWVDARGRRWLRTGDIGVIDDEGFLTIVDRKKDMILSGGQNVYPADIEAVMIGHPAVAEVAVIGVPSERWGETPVAIVVPRVSRAAEVGALGDELLAFTNARLGRQQRVARIEWREALPRNPNGKVLKRELRAEYAVPGAAAERDA